MTETDTDAVRRILLLAHTGREEARDVAGAVVASLLDHGLLVRLLEDEAKELELPARGGCRDGRASSTPTRPSASWRS